MPKWCVVHSREVVFSGTMIPMDFNPHSLHQILTRLREQMRCPQCGTHIDVDFPALKMAGEDFMLLQLKCESCSAFIVLHVHMSEQQRREVMLGRDAMMNASSSLSLTEDEMATLRNALASAEGSFEKLFHNFEKK